MQLHELSGRRVVLLGLGADVRAAVPAILAARPRDVVVVDDGGGALPEGVSRSVALADAWRDRVPDVVFVRSPGFPRYQPALAEAMERGARMTTPLDLWMGTHGPDRKVVCITGTKGKSTVTELVGRLARSCGLDVGVAGNLGVPVFDPGWDSAAPTIILEVSSYQAADLHHVPDLAVLTFLAEDHLSWHGGVERYVSDKLRVLRNEGGTARRIYIPAAGGRAAEVCAAAGLEVEVVASVPLPEGASIPAHRVQNAALAAAVLAGLGGPLLSESDVVEAARTSLPGRLDPCPGPEGVLCVDDALASNPSATAAGLAWLRSLDRPTVVILGGADRGVDPAPLIEEVARWAPGRLVAMTVPDNGDDLAGQVGIEVVGRSAGVADAVGRARDRARVGSAILFSPGAPTPAASGNWQTRSSEFRSALLA